MKKLLKYLVIVVALLLLIIFFIWYNFYDFAKGVQEDAIKRAEMDLPEIVINQGAEDSLIYHYGYDEHGVAINYRRFDLSRDDVRIADSLIDLAVQIFNQDYYDPIELAEYEHRSLSGFINEMENKIVGIYYSCQYHKFPAIVKDGGKCIFRLEVNLSKKTFTPIIINSEA